jgi:streptogramin lyase
MDTPRGTAAYWPRAVAIAATIATALSLVYTGNGTRASTASSIVRLTVLACGDRLVQPVAVVRRLPGFERLPALTWRRNGLSWRGSGSYAPGYYEVHVTEGRCRTWIHMAVVSGLERTLVAPLLPSAQARPTTGGIVAILPLGGLQVYVVPKPAVSPAPIWLSSESGRAIADSLAPGTYRVEVSFSNCCGFSRDVDVRPNQLTVVRITTEEYYQEIFARRKENAQGVRNLAFAPDGSMWFVEYLGVETRIGHLDAQRVLHEFRLPPGGWGVETLAPQADGSVWILGTYGVLRRLSPSGQVQEFPQIGSSVWAHSTVASDGAAWLLQPFQTMTVYHADPSGLVRSYVIGDNDEQADAPTPDDRGGFWFVESKLERIVHVDRDGTISRLDIPWSPCFPGNLTNWRTLLAFTCSAGETAIGAIDAKNAFRRIVGPRHAGVYFLVTDDIGNLWTYDRSGSAVSVGSDFKVTDHKLPAAIQDIREMLTAGDGIIIVDAGTKKFYRVAASGPVSELLLGFKSLRDDEFVRASAADLWLVRPREKTFLKIASDGSSQRVVIEPATVRMP